MTKPQHSLEEIKRILKNESSKYGFMMYNTLYFPISIGPHESTMFRFKSRPKRYYITVYRYGGKSILQKGSSVYSLQQDQGRTTWEFVDYMDKHLRYVGNCSGNPSTLETCLDDIQSLLRDLEKETQKETIQKRTEHNDLIQSKYDTLVPSQWNDTVKPLLTQIKSMSDIDTSTLTESDIQALTDIFQKLQDLLLTGDYPDTIMKPEVDSGGYQTQEPTISIELIQHLRELNFQTQLKKRLEYLRKKIFDSNETETVSTTPDIPKGFPSSGSGRRRRRSSTRRHQRRSRSQRRSRRRQSWGRRRRSGSRRRRSGNRRR